MSGYSEVIGSFLRRGPFPLEADYVFKTEEALKEYYAKPANRPILHRGLLKVVEDDGEGRQALYWITGDGDNGLAFKKLLTDGGMAGAEEKMKELADKVEKEIKDRKDWQDLFTGSTDHESMPDGLDSLLDLGNAIKGLQDEMEAAKEKQDQHTKEIKALAGTEEADVTAFLETLEYPSIRKLSERLSEFFTESNEESQEVDSWKELKKFFAGVSSDDTLFGILDQWLQKVYGDPVPCSDMLTLRGVEDYIRKVESSNQNAIGNVQKELNDTQAGVGLDGDGKYSPDQETAYLKEATSVMNALRTLDQQLQKVARKKMIEAENKDVIDLQVRKDMERTIVSATLKVSDELGNGIKKMHDGVYMKVRSELEDGILTLYVNDNVVSQHVLGWTSIVEDAKYDPDQEAIEIVFKTQGDGRQVLRIPVGSLIREWTVDNGGANDVVELTRVEEAGTGADKLSADVRIAPDKHNILTKKGNALYVEGTAENIVHDDVKVSELLDGIKDTLEKKADLVDGKIPADQVSVPGLYWFDVYPDIPKQ